MSTQQDIYATGSEIRPPMLNKDNYVPWSSRIIRYARSRPNGKMIVDSIENGPYVRRMIATLGEPDLSVPVPESFHEQTDEELTENDIKRMDADDQAIQTILLGLPKDVYAAVDSYETAKEIWERVRQMMKGSDIGEQEKKAKLFNKWEKFTNKHFPKNIAANLKFLNNLQPEWKRHVTIVRQTKNLHEADFTQIYDFLKINQDEVNERRAERLAKTYDPLALMAHSQNSYNFPATYNDQSSSSTHSQQSFPINKIQNAGAQSGGNQNGLVVVPGIANQNGTGNVVAARAEDSVTHCSKEKARIQLQAEEFDFMVAVGDLDKIEEVNANRILMANLQHASTSGTQLDKALVYDIDGLAEVQLNDNFYDNEIFNMFTQEEQYTDLLKLIPEPQLVPHSDNHVTSVAPSIVQSEGTVETSSAPNEETRAHQKTVYRNLFDQVAQVEWLQAQLRDFKGKSSDTPSASNILDPLNQKLESKIIELEFQVLRARVFENTFESMKNTSRTSVTPHIDKPKLSAVTPHSKKLHASISSHSVPQPREFNVVKHRNFIAPGMFKINPSQTSRENVSSDMVNASSTGLVLTARTRRLQPKGNTRNARVLLHLRVVKSRKILCVNAFPSANRKRHRTQVVQICLWCVDSGCSKHMARNIKLLINFVWKFLGPVRFGNDHIAAILGNITITRVYFVEGLGHNLFSVGQFCDADLEVAFRRNTCFIRDLDGVDLLKGKSKRASHPPKLVPNSKQRLHLFHMDLCGPMRVACINGKRYVLVIVDYYSRYTWVYFLRIKDGTPEVIKNFLKKVYVRLQAPVIIVRTDNETKFKNHILKEYFNSVGITHETFAAKTPQQNGVVERKNRTLVEAARTMALCYPKNDREDIGKLGAKDDIGFFIGYSANLFLTECITGGQRKSWRR
nr:integrase, catalytic region, zinc finger, CCHC-type, peptidase aspartic, catalytic [Tanacetum cinerariifolium]